MCIYIYIYIYVGHLFGKSPNIYARGSRAMYFARFYLKREGKKISFTTGFMEEGCKLKKTHNKCVSPPSPQCSSVVGDSMW